MASVGINLESIEFEQLKQNLSEDGPICYYLKEIAEQMRVANELKRDELLMHQ